MPIHNGICKAVLILLCWSVCPASLTSKLPAFTDFRNFESFVLFVQVIICTLWQVLAGEMERRD